MDASRENTAVVNCTDGSAMFDQRCWDLLDIPDYLGNATGWVWTFPKCDGFVQWNR